MSEPIEMINKFLFSKKKYISIVVVILIFSLNSFGQSEGDFRSRQTGDWNDSDSWEEFTGGSWQNTANTPSDSDGAITVLNTHTITITASVTVDETTIDSGGTVEIAEFNTLTVADGAGDDLTVNGTLTLLDDFFFDGSVLSVNGQVVNTGSITINDTNLSAVNFNSGSTYEHNQSNGTVPEATWSASSTISINIGSSNSSPTNLDQTFGNFIWNSSSQTSTTNMSLSGSTTIVQGDFSVLNTNNRVLVISTGSGVTLQVDGNVVISGTSRLALTSSGSVTLIVAGSFTYTSSQSSFLATSGTGTLSVDGNVEVSSGTLQANSNSVLNFTGSSVQSFTAGGTFTNVAFDINGGAIVDVGTSAFSGGGTFNLAATGTLHVGAVDASGAIQSGTTAGNIRVNGTRTFNDGATIVYNGASAQAIGNGFPSSGEVNLTVDNGSGVMLTNDLTVNSSRSLTLTDGNLEIDANLLTLNGSVTGSGALEGGSTSDLTIGGTGNFGTLNFATTTSLNDFTINRTSSGNVTLGSDLTILGTFTQTAGNLTLNGANFNINSDFSYTSGSLVCDASSTLVVDGSGTLPAAAAMSGSLDTFTLDRSGSTFSTAASLTITNLNLFSGVFDNSGTITIADNGIITRQDDGSMNSAPSAAGVYDVVYNNSGALTTGVELPTNSTDLDDLTKQGAGTLNLNSSITVNGILTLSSGIFDAGANGVTLEGNFVSNSTSDFSGNTVTMAGTTTLSGSTSPTFNNLTVASTFTPDIDYQIDDDLVDNGTLNAGSGDVTFGGSTAISGSGAPSFNTVTISGALTASSGTMNVAGDFINNGTFNNNSGLIVFNGTTNISGSSNPDFFDITLTGTLNSPTTLSIEGDWENNGGTFNHNDNAVSFGGSVAQTIAGSSATTFFDMDVSNSNGVSVTGTANLEGLFTLSGSGVFDADGSGSGIFVVQSNGVTDDDAAIGDLTGVTANFTGGVTIQRYIDGPDDWRYISAPITDGNLGMWRDDFSVTGNFSDATTPAEDPNVTHSTAASVYYYDASADDWVAVSGGGAATSTVALGNGVGYAAYIYNPLDFTFSVRGSIGKGTVNISLTSDAGGRFNLVGNPYPSAIDWDNIDQTGLSSTMSIRTANNTFSTWNGTVATNAPFVGWEGEVSMGQSFWVESISSGTLTINESDKTTNQNHFLRTSEPENYIRVSLSNSSQKDEAIVMFEEDATEGRDLEYDALKRKNGSGSGNSYNYLNLSSVNEEGQDFTINVMPYINCTKSLKLNVADVSEGAYQLAFSDMNTFNLPYDVTLVDNFLNETFDVTDGKVYTFEVTSDSDSYGVNRFSLNFDAQPANLNAEVQLDKPEICNTEGAIVRISASEITATYELFINDFLVDEVIEGNGSTIAFIVDEGQVGIGENNMKVRVTKSGCDPVYLLSEPQLLVNSTPQISSVFGDEVCEGGDATLEVSSEQEDVQFNWYYHESDIEPFEKTEGVVIVNNLTESATYFVSAIANGCEGERVSIDAEVTPMPEPYVTVDGNKLNSSADEGNQWYKDNEPLEGATSNTFEVTQSGEYFVEVTSLGCSNSSETITFEITDIREEKLKGVISIFPNPFSSYINVNNSSPKKIIGLELVDLSGKVIIDFSDIEIRENNLLDLPTLNAGAYILNVRTSDGIKSYRLFKAK